jgi:hypothetical protein
MSGLYLHSPASEGMWMGALQKHTGKGVPAPPVPDLRAAPPFLDSICITTKKERSHEQCRKSPQDQLHRVFIPPTLSRPSSFYAAVFGWTFVDYGPDYVSFQGAGIDGGFVKREAA